MSKIYIIVREEGYYSDYGMDVIKAIATEQIAKDFVQNANILEQIKIDKEQEIRNFMLEWRNQNPEPVRPNNLSHVNGDYEKWRREIWFPYNEKAVEQRKEFEKKLLETHYGEYKDFKFVAHREQKNYFSDVTYSYQEMQVEGDEVN